MLLCGQHGFYRFRMILGAHPVPRNAVAVTGFEREQSRRQFKLARIAVQDALPEIPCGEAIRQCDCDPSPDKRGLHTAPQETR